MCKLLFEGNMLELSITILISFIGGIVYKKIWDIVNPKNNFYYKITWLDKTTNKTNSEYVVLNKEMTVSTYKKIIDKINHFSDLKSGGIIESIRVTKNSDYELYERNWK